MFAARLQEFYGVLALHYSKADDKDKAEEYLVKAGEATLQSAASHEALSYLEEAMKLYVQKYGASADPDRIAMFERNIGVAHNNKGMLVDAVRHFDKALEAMGDRDPVNRLAMVLRGLWDFLWIVKDLYLPSHKKKSELTAKDRFRFDLRHARANALANFDPKRLFFDLLRTIHWRNGFQLPPSEGCRMYSLGSSLMIFGGISSTLARKFLERAETAAVPDDTRTFLDHKYSYYLYHYHVGKWNVDLNFDEELFRTGMKLGEFYPACYYISYAHYIGVGRGDFEFSRRLSDMLLEIAEAYDYEYALLDHLTMVVYHHFDRGESREMLRAAQASLELESKIGLDTWMVGGEGLIAMAHILAGDLAKADEALARGEQSLARLGTISHMFTMNLYFGRLQLEVLRLERLLSKGKQADNRAQIAEVSKRARKSSKLLLRQFRTLTEHQPEGYRYTGTLYWLEGKSAKAIKYWKKAIEAASTMPKPQEAG